MKTIVVLRAVQKDFLNDLTSVYQMLDPDKKIELLGN
jgi:hypothetical protein